MSNTNTFEIQLTQEQMEYILKQTGAKNASEGLVSNINLELIKAQLLELVPQLTELHKDDLRHFLAKKFKLEIPKQVE